MDQLPDSKRKGSQEPEMKTTKIPKLASSPASSSTSSSPSSSTSPSVTIGIDFGATTCCVAFHRDRVEKPEVLKSDSGKTTTPSYVAYSAQEDEDAEPDICAGQAAKVLAYENPESTIFDIKRLIGRSFDDQSIQRFKELWPFHVVDVDGQAGVKVGDQMILPQVIAKELISHLKKAAEASLGCPINSAVVTIPVYYNELQKSLTKWAFEEAGLTSIDLIPEPVAAAIAYGLVSFIENRKTKTCLTYDLGGGSLDVTVFKIDANNQVEIKAMGSDPNLGGDNFNTLLAEYCINEIKRVKGIDLSEEKASDDAEVRKKTEKRLRRIRAECEKKKCTLSNIPSVAISMDDGVRRDKSMNVRVSREVFEGLIGALLTRSIQVVDETLKKSRLKKSTIDEVILIGGSSRIPKVREMVVEEYFEGKSLLKSIIADHVVACGAATHAYYILKGFVAPLSIVTRQEQMQWSTKIKGLPARSAHAAVAVGGTIYCFGGIIEFDWTDQEEDPLDAFVLNVNEPKMEWKKLPLKEDEFIPNPRRGHSAVAYNDAVFIFGGQDTLKKDKAQYSNSLYRFNTHTKKWDKPEISGNIPSARSGHTAVVFGNEMLIFGGEGDDVTNEIHSLDLDTYHWSKIDAKGIPPSHRDGHSATVYKDTMFIFGGGRRDSGKYKHFNDLFCFNVISKEWTKPKTSGTPPKGRFGHSAFIHGGLLFIFGGHDYSELNDSYSYDPETCEWKVKPSRQPPSPRSNAACVVLDDRVFLFGGQSYRLGPQKDTYVLKICKISFKTNNFLQ